MAFTQITGQVISANAINSTLVGNNAILTRHIITGAVSADKLSANVSDFFSTANALNNVQSNLTTLNTAFTAHVVRANANLVSVQSNITSLQGGLTGSNTIIVALGSNVANLQVGISGSNTSLAGAQSNIITLQTFATSAQSNIASIINGSSQFTDNVTMQKSLIIQGNLYVLGSQVDLSVGSTAIYDAIITLNANLSSSLPPPADAGILINRGNEDNIFIGTGTVDPRVKFVYTNSPGDNASISIKNYIGVIANAFHATASSQTQPAFGSYSDQNTGVHFPQPDTLTLVTGGIIQANITSAGNLVLTSGHVASFGQKNFIDLETTRLANSISLGSVTNIALFLDTNNNNNDNFFGIYNDTADMGQNVDSAILSVRDTGTLFSKGNLNYISSNATTDVNSGNAIISTRVFSSGVELRSNDYSTYATVTANTFATYTRLNANLNTVSSNTDSKLSLSGGTMSGNITMGAKYINNLADPTQAQDAATRAYVLAISGGTALTPVYTTNTSSGSSNVIAIEINTPLAITRTAVYLSGVIQTPTSDYVLNLANNSIQYTVVTLPAGLTTVIQSWG
jgi:hypothetical protein